MTLSSHDHLPCQRRISLRCSGPWRRQLTSDRSFLEACDALQGSEARTGTVVDAARTRPFSPTPARPGTAPRQVVGFLTGFSKGSRASWRVLDTLLTGLL